MRRFLLTASFIGGVHCERRNQENAAQTVSKYPAAILTSTSTPPSLGLECFAIDEYSEGKPTS